MLTQVYTFAGPRAGNYTFTAYIANCYPRKVFRLVHSSDLVPKVTCSCMQCQMCVLHFGNCKLILIYPAQPSLASMHIARCAWPPRLECSKACMPQVAACGSM